MAAVPVPGAWPAGAPPPPVEEPTPGACVAEAPSPLWGAGRPSARRCRDVGGAGELSSRFPAPGGQDGPRAGDGAWGACADQRSLSGERVKAHGGRAVPTAGTVPSRQEVAVLASAHRAWGRRRPEGDWAQALASALGPWSWVWGSVLVPPSRHAHSCAHTHTPPHCHCRCHFRCLPGAWSGGRRWGRGTWRFLSWCFRKRLACPQHGSPALWRPHREPSGRRGPAPEGVWVALLTVFETDLTYFGHQSPPSSLVPTLAAPLPRLGLSSGGLEESCPPGIGAARGLALLVMSTRYVQGPEALGDRWLPRCTNMS